MVREKCSTTSVGDVVCSAVGRMRRYAKLSEGPAVACIARALEISTAKVVAMLHARFEAVSREGEGKVDECSFTGARCRPNSLIGSCGSWPSPCPVRGAPAADRPAKFTSAPDRSLQKFCSLTRNIQSFTSLRISRVAVQLIEWSASPQWLRLDHWSSAPIAATCSSRTRGAKHPLRAMSVALRIKVL